MENMSPALWAGDMFSMKYRIGIYKKIYKVIIIDNSTLWEGGMYRSNLVEVIGQPVVRSVNFFLYWQGYPSITYLLISNYNNRVIRKFLCMII